MGCRLSWFGPAHSFYPRAAGKVAYRISRREPGIFSRRFITRRQVERRGDLPKWRPALASLASRFIGRSSLRIQACELAWPKLLPPLATGTFCEGILWSGTRRRLAAPH